MVILKVPGIDASDELSTSWMRCFTLSYNPPNRGTRSNLGDSENNSFCFSPRGSIVSRDSSSCMGLTSCFRPSGDMADEQPVRRGFRLDICSRSTPTEAVARAIATAFLSTIGSNNHLILIASLSAMTVPFRRPQADLPNARRPR